MTILSTTILAHLLTSSAAMWITAGILFVALALVTVLMVVHEGTEGEGYDKRLIGIAAASVAIGLSLIAYGSTVCEKKDVYRDTVAVMNRKNDILTIVPFYGNTDDTYANVYFKHDRSDVVTEKTIGHVRFDKKAKNLSIGKGKDSGHVLIIPYLYIHSEKIPKNIFEDTE